MARQKWAGPKGMDNLFPFKTSSHFDPLLNQKTEKHKKKNSQLKFTSNSTSLRTLGCLWLLLTGG